MDNKFPALKGYQAVLGLFAAVFFFAGVWIAYESVKGFNGQTDFSNPNNIRTAFIVFTPFFLIALALGVFAELISLFLRIEDHLSAIRWIQERSAGVSRKSSSAQVDKLRTSPEAIEATSEEDIVKIIGVVKSATKMKSFPGARRNSRGMLQSGDKVSLYSRNVDNRWIEIDGDGEHWVLAEDLDIQGDVTLLPVTSIHQ